MAKNQEEIKKGKSAKSKSHHSKKKKKKIGTRIMAIILAGMMVISVAATLIYALIFAA